MKLNRYTEHRLSMLRNLAIDLVDNGSIKTTMARAKQLRSFVEPFITKAKIENLTTRRYLLSKLNNRKDIVDKLFKLGQINKDRQGGYTSVLLFDFRGDGGQRALIRILDYLP